MQRISSAMMLLWLVASVVFSEAAILNRISPKLQPRSSKKFEKDLTGDKRPAVDILHFNHPYPVVQDSEDFDKDFVKDQNKDNGEWMAQMEYDKMRHRVAELKKKAAKALEKKVHEQKELDEARAKYRADMAKDESEIARKTTEEEALLKPLTTQKPVKATKTTTTEKPAVKEEEEEKSSSWSWPSWSWPSWSWPSSAPKVEKEKQEKQDTTEKPKLKGTTEEPTTTTAAPKRKTTPAPKPTLAPIDTAAAEQAVEKAVQQLEGCQKELAQARGELKDLMEQLKEAKLKQVEAQEKLKQADMKHKEAQKREKEVKSKYTAESKEYVEAEAAFLKQKALVEKLRAQLQLASKKVEAMRAAEDKQGGVYPVPSKEKNSASSGAVSVAAFALLASWQMA